ncbi:MAG: tail fiber domain-containing protein [Sulfuricaulis sp.]|nr:tail fiber domain-containing protein [Sulfuricaulis sp.]
MKIYTRVVMDSMTGKIEEEDSFEYEGPITELKDSPSAPPAPDYTGAAQATATGNLENARYATRANRINQYTPYGSLTYTESPAGTSSNTFSNSAANDEVQRLMSQNGTSFDEAMQQVSQGWGLAMPAGGAAGGTDQWRSDLTLDPRAQRTLDTQMNLSNQMGDMTSGAMGQVAAQGPMDLSSVQRVADQSYADQTARLDPQWEQRKGQFDQQMANQGITAGGEAYGNASRDFGQQRNDAYTQARQAALATMPQTYQLAQAAYDQPLNRANALRTGAQVQNPTFQQAGMQQATPGANYMGAAQAQGQYDQGLYNSQVAGDNSMMSGLFGLGAAGITKWSDRRLKRDIVKVSDDPRGFGWYAFRYLWSDALHIGVMADEVPHAARRHPSGFMQVDYGAL